MFPPLVATPPYNTHFWNISWTSDSLVTIRRLINVHFGITGGKDMRDPWMHIIFFPPYVSLMLGIQLSQDWLCRPGWGSRDSRRISDLHSPSEKFLLSVSASTGPALRQEDEEEETRQRSSSCLGCERNCM